MQRSRSVSKGTSGASSPSSGGGLASTGVSHTCAPPKNAATVRSTSPKYSSAASSEPSGFRVLLGEAERPRLEQRDAGRPGRPAAELLDELRGPVGPERQEVLRELFARERGRALDDACPRSAHSFAAASVAAFTSGWGSSPK